MIADEIVQAAALPQGDARAAREVVRRRHTRAQVLLVPRARACPERSRRMIADQEGQRDPLPHRNTRAEVLLEQLPS